jgi:hypothetical protein
MISKRWKDRKTFWLFFGSLASIGRQDAPSNIRVAYLQLAIASRQFFRE